jgi:hypothetical protein
VKVQEFEIEFVEFVPADLADGVLYISMQYATASHRCACGCGHRVVTPIGPADWRLTFDGTVTLSPSIGNGQIDCRSHYFIRSNRVLWASPMTDEMTQIASERDRRDLLMRHAASRPWWGKLLARPRRRR